MKATARAYAIQGLIKYHGLRSPKLRIPYHDSISVCMKSLPTITTVEYQRELKGDAVRIDGVTPAKMDLARVMTVLEKLRHVAGNRRARFRVESRNPRVNGKGLGFSAAGFAALGLATSRALGLRLGERELTEIVRLGAGSAARSLVGGFSIWYASRYGRSYAEQLAAADAIPLRTIIVPIPSGLKTDKAHEESIRSPLYNARLRHLPTRLILMRRAIQRGEVDSIGRLTEEDTLNLHAVTMTGPKGIVLFSPLSIAVINEVRRLRGEEEMPAWFSLDTGPSVFVNTTKDAAGRVEKSLSKLTGQFLRTQPGGPAELLTKHLF